MDSKCIKKPKFSHDWLENDNYKSWIKEVPNDTSSYFCDVCNKSFSCASRVSKHAASEAHRNNMAKSYEERRNEKTNEKESRKREFFPSWLENKQFQPWLQKVPDDPYSCFCSVCNSTFRCGLDALKRHSETRKHISECQKKGVIMDFDEPDEQSPLTFANRKKIAEIKFAALIAEKNIPFQTAQSILDFFQDFGKDPEILNSMTMNRKKGPEIINKVLYVREQERIVEALQNNKFSIFINETSDTTSNDTWMTFLVRYVNSLTLNVHTELFDFIHLDATNYDCIEKLFTTFKEEMEKKKIPFENILALSCGSTFVMTEKYEFFKTELQKYCENLIVMPCPCHVSASIANAACTVIPAACEEFLRKVSSFISKNPKRALIFEEFQKSFNFNDNNKKIFKLSEMRWMSRHSCVVTLNKNWNTLLKFLQEEQLKQKSKSGAVLLSMMQNPEIQPYFLFLEYILHAFDEFNASFQTEETKVYLLQSAAKNLLKTVLRNVVKPSLLKLAVNGIINPLLACNRRSQITVGRSCKELLDQLNQEGHEEIVKSVYLNCSSFCDIAAEEIRLRLFVKEEFLSKLWIFDPKFALQQKDEKDKPNKSAQDVLSVAKRLAGFNEKMLKKEWQSLDLDFTLKEKEEIINLDFDDAWKTIITTRDADGKLKYPTLTNLVNIIRSLPNSNADSDKMFSMLAGVKTKKRNKLCSIHVQALCVLKSSLKARGQTARTMSVDARHLALMTTENLYHTNAK